MSEVDGRVGVTTIVVVNHDHSTICGIHDLGRRVYDRLKEVYDGAWYVPAGYPTDIPVADVTLFNYRSDLMPWVVPALPQIGGVKAAILHNYDLDTLDQRAGELLAQGFDRVVVLDPDAKPSDERVVVTGRFLPQRVEPQPLPDDVLLIGSFGFAFPHKRFEAVAQAVRYLGKHQDVVYRLHTPEAYFNGAEGGALYAQGVYDAVTAVLPPEQVEHTTDHRSDAELVEWLASNHVNCLLYTPGQPDAGLSSALDYLIAARRPILVSDASMFRHGGIAVCHWPATSLANVVDIRSRLVSWVTRLADEYDESSARMLIDGLTR